MIPQGGPHQRHQAPHLQQQLQQQPQQQQQQQQPQPQPQPLQIQNGVGGGGYPVLQPPPQQQQQFQQQFVHQINGNTSRFQQQQSHATPVPSSSPVKSFPGDDHPIPVSPENKTHDLEQLEGLLLGEDLTDVKVIGGKRKSAKSQGHPHGTLHVPSAVQVLSLLCDFGRTPTQSFRNKGAGSLDRGGRDLHKIVPSLLLHALDLERTIVWEGGESFRSPSKMPPTPNTNSLLEVQK